MPASSEPGPVQARRPSGGERRCGAAFLERPNRRQETGGRRQKNIEYSAFRGSSLAAPISLLFCILHSAFCILAVTGVEPRVAWPCVPRRYSIAWVFCCPGQGRETGDWRLEAGSGSVAHQPLASSP